MTLARRLILLASVVALVSVAITGLTMLGLYRQGATGAAAAALQREAGTAAVTLSTVSQRRPGRLGLRTEQLDRQLGRRQITLSVSAAGSSGGTDVEAPFVATDVTTSERDGGLSTQRRIDGVDWVVVGDTEGGVTVLLAQPLDQAVTEGGRGTGRLLLSLIVGLAAGAVAGLVLARQLSGPLSRVAAGARELLGGHRDVRVPEEGPAEVADVARALNELGVALGGSEARQRRFLLDVSHELRTPLTAVTGYAEGLADGAIPADEVPAAAAVIQQEAARLGRRIEELMALARLEADDFRLRFAPADLADLVAASAAACRPRAEAAGIRLEQAATAIVLVTDAERVRQALDALLDNALRVLPAGSTVRVSCGGSAGTGWLEVADDGPGLAEEDLAVAFERGRLSDRYRGDRPVGSGLGLALVGELARRLGGTARAGQAATGGAAFRIDLPVHPEPPGDDHACSPGMEPGMEPGNPNTPRTFG